TEQWPCLSSHLHRGKLPGQPVPVDTSTDRQTQDLRIDLQKLQHTFDLSHLSYAMLHCTQGPRETRIPREGARKAATTPLKGFTQCARPSAPLSPPSLPSALPAAPWRRK